MGDDVLIKIIWHSVIAVVEHFCMRAFIYSFSACMVLHYVFCTSSVYFSSVAFKGALSLVVFRCFE